jgi:hypothetical protein
MNYRYWLVSAGIFFALLLALFAMGRVPWCECGYVKVWHGAVQSSENSQHLTDWYTPSHIIHGFLFYLFLRFIEKKKERSFGLLVALALFFEVSWEVFENTDFVINRYRTATIAFDYYGDSIINSATDVLAMLLGFWLAHKLPVWAVVTAAIVLEAVVGYAIRDNLFLNIIMLIYPFAFIKNWQMGI